MNHKLKSKAIFLLAQREYAYQELYTKLKKYSDNEKDIKELLQALIGTGWLSEERYIKSYLDSKNKKYGTLKIKHTLTQKTLNPELVNHILRENPINEYTVARRLWLKKFGQIATEKKELTRQIRFLQNRGFSLAIIKRVIDQLDEISDEIE